MKRRLILLCVLLIAAGYVFFGQRASLTRARGVNAQLAAQSVVLQKRASELQERHDALKRQLTETEDRVHELRHAPAGSVSPESPPMVPPDPGHQGGWPPNTPYFYLPKKDLAAVGYRLFEAHRLTDDAATLFGMTSAEREAVNAAYDELWRKFRQLEIARMEPVEKPSAQDTNSPLWRYIGPNLQARMSDSYTAYRIPSLESEAEALVAEFAGALQQTLGPTRASCLREAANASFASQLDDLGRHARMVCFFQIQDPSGQTKLVYGLVNEGLNGQTWMLQPPLDPNSQEAYYARLFGVDVPVRDQ